MKDPRSSRVIPVLCAALLLMASCLTVSASEVKVTSTAPYYTGYFTGFGYTIGNNVYKALDGSVHMATVQNYELFYHTSSDGGATWSSTKVETGHDGDVHWAALAVDRNGHVFVAFDVHDWFNYANPTGVSFFYEFRYDLYCANNVSGAWAIEKLFTASSSNYGASAAAVVVDDNNDVHVMAFRNGWYTYGGTLWEWVRDSSSGTWGPQTTVVSYSDTGVDKFLYWYVSPVVASDGTITVLGGRYPQNGATADRLFYVDNSGGTWNAPVTLETGVRRTHAGSAWFDSAIDSGGDIHSVYYTSDVDDSSDIYYSVNFGSPSVIYTGAVSELIYNLKLHSDAAGNLTLVIQCSAFTTRLLDKPAGGAWATEPRFHVTGVPDGDVNGYNITRTDTALGDFCPFAMAYFDRPVPSPTAPYGPDDIYYFASPPPGPSVDVKVNGQDGPLALNVSDPMEVTVSVHPGPDPGGALLDYWVLAITPIGLHYYDRQSGEFVVGFTTTAQAPLLPVAETVVLSLSSSIAGDFRFAMVLDDQPDGRYNGNKLLDVVDVTVSPDP